MAETPPRRVVLMFGDNHVEVPAVDEIEELQQYAEAEFGLHPDSYAFYDACGKVESSALQRVLRIGNGMCVLDVRERPEWRKIRELEARIELLAEQAATGVTEEAVQFLEDRLLSKVQDLLIDLAADLGQAEAKMDGVLAPIIQSLALAQIDVKAKLDSFDAAAMQARLDSVEERVAGALSHADILDERVAAAVSRADVLEERVAAAGPRLAQKDHGGLQGIPASWLDTAGALDASQRPQVDLEPFQVEVRQFEQAQAAVVAGTTGFLLKRSPSKPARGGSDARLPWTEGSAIMSETLPAKSGSKAWHRAAKQNDEWGDAAAAPFARSAAPRQLDRKAMSCSLPHLPPVF